MTKWRLIDSQNILESPWITVRNNTYTLPSGENVEDYYVLERSDFVLVVALVDGNLVLVRQFRPATNQFYISLPAGYIGSGEKPEAAAVRELEEETGLTGGPAELAGVLHPLPGYIKSYAHVVLCPQAQGILKVADQDEIEAAFSVPFGKAVAMVNSGEIIEMQAVAAILLAANKLQKL